VGVAVNDGNPQREDRDTPPDGLERLWIDRARTGDRTAFEHLYRHRVGAVYGLCLRLTGRPDQADDATQEAFIAAWRALPGFEGRSALGTWLHRIAVNSVLQHGRYRSRRVAVSASAIENAPDIPSEHEPPLDLEAAIASLPDGARHVLVLVGLYGYTHGEAAQWLGIAEGTSKAHLHWARQRLLMFIERSRCDDLP